MSKSMYIGMDNIARKVKAIYIGIDGVARKVKNGYVGVNGVARQFYKSSKIEMLNKITITFIPKLVTHRYDSYCTIGETVNVSGLPEGCSENDISFIACISETRDMYFGGLNIKNFRSVSEEQEIPTIYSKLYFLDSDISKEINSVEDTCHIDSAGELFIDFGDEGYWSEFGDYMLTYCEIQKPCTLVCEIYKETRDARVDIQTTPYQTINVTTNGQTYNENFITYSGLKYTVTVNTTKPYYKPGTLNTTNGTFKEGSNFISVTPPTSDIVPYKGGMTPLTKYNVWGQSVAVVGNTYAIFYVEDNVSAYDSSLTKVMSKDISDTMDTDNGGGINVGDYAVFIPRNIVVVAFDKSLTEHRPSALSEESRKARLVNFSEKALRIGGYRYNNGSYTYIRKIQAYDSSLTRSIPASLGYNHSLGHYVNVVGKNLIVAGGSDTYSSGWNNSVEVEAFNQSFTRTILKRLSSKNNSYGYKVGERVILGDDWMNIGNREYDKDCYDSSLTKTMIKVYVYSGFADAPVRCDFQHRDYTISFVREDGGYIIDKSLSFRCFNYQLDEGSSVSRPKIDSTEAPPVLMGDYYITNSNKRYYPIAIDTTKFDKLIDYVINN